MRAIKNERLRLLRNIHDLFEEPLVVLSIIWLVLIILEFINGLNQILLTATYIIWVIFIIDFAIEIILAPNKRLYLKRNWLTLLSLFLPIVRLFSVFRTIKILDLSRTLRSVNLVKILVSLNKGISTFKNILQSRGVAYISILTLFIILLGAAGIAYFESPEALSVGGYIQKGDTETGITNYGEAVWFTAMLITTLGSAYWPLSIEGRILTFVLSVYGLAIFGYITATIANLLIGRGRK